MQHVLHYPTVPMKVKTPALIGGGGGGGWGGKLRVPIHPLLVEWRSN